MTSTPTRLRPAVAADLDPLVALDRDAFGRNAWSREALAAELDPAASGRYAALAEADAVACGYVIALLGPDVAEILRVAVASSRRRLGIGTRLVENAVDAARSAGCGAIMLEVVADNEPARSLYAALGFAPLDVRPRYYPDGSDAAILRLALGADDPR